MTSVKVAHSARLALSTTTNGSKTKPEPVRKITHQKAGQTTD